MIILKSREEIEQLRLAGQLVARCHQEIRPMIKPGVTTMQINQYVEHLIKKLGGEQYLKGYHGFPAATCMSANDVIAHGFPSSKPLEEGDILKVDIVAVYNGWVGDSAWCYAVGRIDEEAERLMKVAKECLYKGIEQAVAGNRIGDVTHQIQQHAESQGFSVVRDLLAHGVGRSVHEEPNFPHVGKPGKGFRLKAGMVITIEPMINAGTYRMTVDEDGWTTRTADGKWSAQYEHTVAITEDGPLILTEQLG